MSSYSLVSEIPLTGGLVAIVDSSDFELISKYKWHSDKHKSRKGLIYARSNVNGKKKRLHRLILDVPSHLKIDHINGNGLDNRRSNLRICTNSQNLRRVWKKSKNPTSKYKGVSWRAANAKWIMQIRTDNIKIHKYFDTEIEAAIAYNEAALKYHGEFANLNTFH